MNVLTHTTVWMSLEDVMLSKRNQLLKDTSWSPGGKILKIDKEKKEKRLKKREEAAGVWRLVALDF